MPAAEPLVPYRITICGLAELGEHAAAGCSHVVSILDPTWPDPADFATYGPHRRVVWRFDDVVAARVGVVAPGLPDVSAIVALGETLEREGAEHVLIHCHAGISRSTATAVILLARGNPGREAEAFEAVAGIRPRSWPNALMLQIADDLLGRDGALVAPLADHQRRVAAAYPDFAQLLRGTERAHEVPNL